MNSDVNNLLRKYLDGSITEPEGEELFAWLRDNGIEEEEGIEALLKETYDSSFTEKKKLTDEASERIHAKLMQSVDTLATSETTVISMRRNFARYVAAAAVLLVLAVGTWWLMNKEQPVERTQVAKTEEKKEVLLTLPNGEQVPLDHKQGSVVKKNDFNVINDSGSLSYQGKAAEVEYHTLSTPAGKQYQLKLPDGTEVWLNAASSITFPTVFNGNERKVYIVGEAYFDIAANKVKPFVVDINKKADIEVLGTEFNVNAYTNEPEIVTTLVNGKIRVKKAGLLQVLEPGQQAYIQTDKIEVKKDVDIDMFTAWKRGVFRFNNERADVVLRQLARWYDVEIIYEGAVPTITFGGEINRGSSLEQAVELLNKIGLNTRVTPGKIIVAP